MWTLSQKTLLALASSATGLAIALAPTPRAHACSPLLCAPSVFLPVSGHVPSNAVEFLWQPPWSDSATSTDPSIRLYKLENGQRTELEVEVLAGPEKLKRVRPKQAVAEGTVLVLESDEPACGGAKPVAPMVTVSAPASEPSQLGTLSVGELDASTILNLPTSRGSCRADFEVASAQLKLALNESAQPFVDSLRHTLLVDGVKRVQHSEAAPISNLYPLGGKLEDVLYTLCKGPSDAWTNDLPAGRHRVQWLSTLPDGSELRSNEVTIALSCDADADASTDEDVETGADRAADAAPSEPAQGTQRDATGEATSADAEDESSHDARHTDGCSARSQGHDRGVGVRLFALGLALFFCARRRRQ